MQATSMNNTSQNSRGLGVVRVAPWIPSVLLMVFLLLGRLTGLSPPSREDHYKKVSSVKEDTKARWEHAGSPPRFTMFCPDRALRTNLALRQGSILLYSLEC